jgi:putative flavoprotein involved in K+ transport
LHFLCGHSAITIGLHMLFTRQRGRGVMIQEPSGFPVVVVGAGQAGLAVSYELTARGVEHVVLERARVGQSWLGLWDSFCLVTPNWTMSLPGAAYTGDDPEGFVPRDEIVRYLRRYASSFGAPVREGVGVDSLEPGPGGGFLLRTSAGELRAASVVVCTGAYQVPHRLALAAGFPHDVLVIDARDYRNPTALPPGKVLVVGSGQTGCQLSEELHESGREVFLACGRAPWLPRRSGGRDIVTWLKETSFFDRKRKSSVLFGVGEDAAIVAQSVAHHHRTAPSSARTRSRSHQDGA